MRKIKKIVAAALVTVMAFSMAGCKMIAKTPEAIQKTVLASIGNETITMGDVDSELQADIDYLKEQYGEDYESKLDDNMKEQLKQARLQVLSQLVDEKIILVKGTELGYIPSDEELAADIEAEKARFTELYGGEEGLKQALEYYGMTDEKFNSFIENIVKTQKVQDAVAKDITVTDEDVSKYYEENKDKYTKKAGANSKHILFKAEDDATAEAEALAAKAKIDSGETTFDALFAEYEANKAAGVYPIAEDLGYVENEQENFDTDFLAGFKVLKEGEVSAPIKSSFGYHIIKVDGVVIEESVTPLDEVKDQIKTTLETTKKNEAFTAQIEEWQKELNVKLYEDKV